MGYTQAAQELDVTHGHVLLSPPKWGHTAFLNSFIVLLNFKIDFM